MRASEPGRRRFAIGLGFLYLGWAILVLGAAVLSAGASEGGETSSDSNLLLLLATLALVLATAAFRGVAKGGPRTVLVAVWLAQSALLVAAFVQTADVGGVRIAPPITLATVAAQTIGLAAILLRPTNAGTSATAP